MNTLLTSATLVDVSSDISDKPTPKLVGYSNISQGQPEIEEKTDNKAE